MSFTRNHRIPLYMATELTRRANTITADGDYFWPVRPYQEATVMIEFTTAGSAGTVSLKRGNGDPELDKNDTAIVVNFDDTAGEAYVVNPTGGHINFTAASFAGSPVAKITVFQAPVA